MDAIEVKDVFNSISIGDAAWIMNSGVPREVLEERNQKGLTPLMFAAMRGDSACVSALLAAGATVDSVADGKNGTPLVNALSSGSMDCVRILIDAGADVNLSNSNGDTPLRSAVRSGDEALTRELVGLGASMSARCSGKSILSVAVAVRSERMVRCLLALGADPSEKDDEGRTPDYYAMMFNEVKIHALLSGMIRSMDEQRSLGEMVSGASVGRELDPSRANKHFL